LILSVYASFNSENSLYIASGVAIVENRFVSLNYMMELEMELNEGKGACVLLFLEEKPMIFTLRDMKKFYSRRCYVV
jgi:hypothetical protein